MKSHVSKGIILLLIAELFFSSMWACVKLNGPTIPFFQIIFFRTITSVIIVGLLMLFKGITFRINNKRIMFSRCFFGYIGLAMSFYAFTKMSIGNVATLHHTSPIFVALLSPIFLKERAGLIVILCIIVAFIGVGFIVRPDEGIINTVSIIALLSGLFAALAYMSVRHLRLTDNFYLITFYFALFGAFVSLPLMLQNFTMPDVRELMLLLGAGIFGTFAQLLLTYAYRCTPANLLTPFNNSAVIFSFTYGWILWQEAPDLFTIIGASLIIIASIIISILANKHAIPKTLPRVGE